MLTDDEIRGIMGQAVKFESAGRATLMSIYATRDMHQKDDNDPETQRLLDIEFG